MGVGLVRSLQPPDILQIHWRVYNSIANTSKWVLFLSPSEVYVRSFLYLLYTLIKLYCTKALSDPALLIGPGLNSSPPEAKNPGVFSRFSSNLSITFRIDWFWLLAVQGTLKRLLQHHSSKASILWCSAFFMVQLSHNYWKNHCLTRWAFVGKVMSLPFNMLSRLVVAFLPRSKRLLISWLQSPSAVILEPKKIKSLTISTVSPSISTKWWGCMLWSYFFECWVSSQIFHSPLSLSSISSSVALCFLP